MLLTISTDQLPAGDLGYLLHKHPDRFQSAKLSIGKAHVFYPENSEERTTAALLLDVDPIDLVRNGRHLSGKGFTLGQYVNDRPYVASSFMSVAIAKLFSTALNGRCDKRPELLEKEVRYDVTISVLSAPRGGERLIRSFFEPLGYKVNLEQHTLDKDFPEWGESKYFSVQLTNTLLLKDLLTHLYVLIPALDNDKHYYVAEQEIEKLLSKGGDWFPNHPVRDVIAQRYFKNLKGFTRRAMERLIVNEAENTEAIDNELNAEKSAQTTPEHRTGLHQLRLEAARDELVTCGAKSVIDLGCGEGKLIRLLLKKKQFSQITGTDVSYTELTRCKERLHWDELSPRQRERLHLFQGALTYRDDRLNGYDAAVLVEVIEHLDENRLPALERVIFEFARPKTVVVTTPNAEYNVKYEFLSSGSMRHNDHRFEWTRAEFADWANKIADTNNYSVVFKPVGEVDEAVGGPSQMAVFSIKE